MALNIQNVTHEYFNQYERFFDAQLELYFDGYEEPPFIVTKETFLISANILEEAGAEALNPLGAVSANELSFTLANFDGQFTPTNRLSPHYGKIREGVPVKFMLKPHSDDPDDYPEWVPLGAFFVSNWTSVLEAGYVSVVATDSMQELLLSPFPDFYIQNNLSYADFFRYILGMYGYPHTVDADLNEVLSIGYYDAIDTTDLLQQLSEASMSSIITNRYSTVDVRKLKATTPVVTWTDADQILSANIEQSIIKTYNGVRLTYVLPWLSDYRAVLEVDSFPVFAGSTYHNTTKFPKAVDHVSGVYLAAQYGVDIVSYTATLFGIRLVTNSPATQVADLIVTGKSFDLVEQEISDDIYNMLEIETVYIQNDRYATEYHGTLVRFVEAEIPSLVITARGDALLEINDCVQVSSARLGLEFTGIIKRAEYYYDGGLSCTYTLLNAEVVGG